MRIRTMLLTWVLAAGSLFAGSVSFSDTTFIDGDWNVIKFSDTTPGATGSFTTGQVGLGGNPGSYRRIEQSGANGFVALAHLRDGAVFNPSIQGAITSIDFSFDISAPDAALTKPPAPLNFDILLFQNGNYFTRHALVTAFTSSWENTSMTGAFFEMVPGPGAPDFSSTGSPIKLGFVTAAIDLAACDAPCNVGGIDNWSVTVHFADALDAPEPACLTSILSGLALLAAGARKRRTAIR